MAVSLRTLTVVGVIMASTSVLARVNSVTQAAHEILRQLWILLIQFVECINISNQSIVASAFGSKDLRYALAVVKRHMVYSVAIVSSAAVVMLSLRVPLMGCFTGDAAVVGMAAATFPFLAAMFPLDALVSILDGTLTAAGQATWTARNSTLTSLGVLVALLSVERVMAMSLLKVWMLLKVMTVIRLPLLLHRTFQSRHTPFRIHALEKAPELRLGMSTDQQIALQNHLAQGGVVETQPVGADGEKGSTTT
jgi:Na+-driven multidrug efflux pump